MEEKKNEAPIVSSDDEMEEPKTKNYSENKPKIVVVIKQEFYDALYSTLGNLGYDRIIGTAERNVKVSQIMEITKNVIGQPITEEQTNRLIGMIALAPYNIIDTVMETIKNNQSVYFEVKKVVNNASN